ncbi:MAG: hypothetical protein ACKVP5_06505 [Aestuariivirga sp.]
MQEASSMSIDDHSKTNTLLRNLVACVAVATALQVQSVSSPAAENEGVTKVFNHGGSVIYETTRTSVHASLSVYQALDAVLNEAARLRNFSDKKIESFSVKKRKENFIVALYQYDLRNFRELEDLRKLGLPTIYALVDAKTFAIKKIDLCSLECGIYKLRWLNE